MNQNVNNGNVEYYIEYVQIVNSGNMKEKCL